MRAVTDIANLRPPLLHALAWPLGLALLTLLLARVPGAEHLAPDYLQFWSASSILAEGGNPYDPHLQTDRAAAQGWNLHQHGLGRYAYLPYYYPPWMGLALVPLLPLGYATAKLVWLAMLIEAVVASAYLLRNSVPGMRPASAMLVVGGFGVWWVTLLFGQTAPLVVLFAAAAWRLAEAGRDRSAGWALACLSIKPQLALPVMLCVVVWAMRQKRWRIVEGCATAVAAFVAASTLIFPGWLAAMLDAPRVTPLVTVDAPWLGASWHSLLRTLGFSGTPLAALYLAFAVPTVLTLARQAWDRRTSILAIVSTAMLAVFVLVPYTRYYDLPILVFPLLELLGRPLPLRLRTWLPVVCTLIPLAIWRVWPIDPPVWVAQGQWLWLVAALIVLRFCTTRVENTSRREPDVAILKRLREAAPGL